MRFVREEHAVYESKYTVYEIKSCCVCGIFMLFVSFLTHLELDELHHLARWMLLNELPKCRAIKAFDQPNFMLVIKHHQLENILCQINRDNY